VRFPASHKDVAAYLRHAGKVRGPTVVPVHLSAIARLYRAAGQPLDTKAPVIQRVVKPARDCISHLSPHGCRSANGKGARCADQSG
jgi:hypothetical protein